MISYRIRQPLVKGRHNNKKILIIKTPLKYLIISGQPKSGWTWEIQTSD